MRRPGIEPGSTAWKAAMLTTKPPTRYWINVTLSYQCADWRYRTGHFAKTGERSRPYWPHYTYTETDCRPLEFRFEMYVFPVPWIDLQTKNGANVGSLFSAVIANLYMEEFEEQAITTSPCKPEIWKLT